MKFRKLLLAWLVASTTLMLYSCAEPFPNVQTDREQSRLPNAMKCAEAEKTAKYLSKGCPDRNAKNEACWPSLPYAFHCPKCNPSARTGRERSRLHNAMKYARTEKAIKHLLDDANARPNAVNAVNVNAVDEAGRTPLHYFVGSAIVTQLLLKAGADPNARDKYGVTPLHRATRIGSVKTVKDLLKCGADPNARSRGGSTPLHFAKSAEVAKHLLAYGADPNAKDKLVGWTPLHLARSVEVAKKLLIAGADPNARDKLSKFTPLHRAARIGSEELVKELLERDADPNARSRDGYTPLYVAKSRASGKSAESTEAKIVKLLWKSMRKGKAVSTCKCN